MAEPAKHRTNQENVLILFVVMGAIAPKERHVFISGSKFHWLDALAVGHAVAGGEEFIRVPYETASR